MWFSRVVLSTINQYSLLSSHFDLEIYYSLRNASMNQAVLDNSNCNAKESINGSTVARKVWRNKILRCSRDRMNKNETVSYKKYDFLICTVQVKYECACFL